MPHPHSCYSTQRCFWPRNLLHSKWRVAMGPGLWNLLVLPCSPPSWSGWLDKPVEWSFEDSVTVAGRWQFLAGLGQGFPRGYIRFDSASHSQDSSHSQDWWVQESKGDPLANIPSDPLANFASRSWNLNFCRSTGLSSKGMLLPETTTIPLNQKLRLLPYRVGLPMTLN